MRKVFNNFYENSEFYLNPKKSMCAAFNALAGNNLRGRTGKGNHDVARARGVSEIDREINQPSVRRRFS